MELRPFVKAEFLASLAAYTTGHKTWPEIVAEAKGCQRVPYTWHIWPDGSIEYIVSRKEAKRFPIVLPLSYMGLNVVEAQRYILNIIEGEI